jgi:hypothetical protein
MANTYASTVLQAARLWQQDNMQKKFESRRDLSKVFPVFEDGQNFVPELDEIKKATTQTTTTLYLTKKSFTINSSKSCSPSGETGGSGSVNLSWVQKGFAVQHQTKKYHGNELSSARGLAYDMFEAEMSLWFESSGMEAAMIAYLEANRTQVNALSAGTSGSRNTWRGAANYDVTTLHANRNQFWNYMQADMMINNYSGKLWDVYNTWFTADMNYYSEQGAANSTNTAFQFAQIPGGIAPQPTNLITPSGYFDSTHYIVPEGGVAILFWNEQLNRIGTKTEAGEWTIMESQLFPGVFYDVFIKNSCSDTSDDGGTTQDSVINMEFTLNYALTKQPLSTANATPIFKYQIYSS